MPEYPGMPRVLLASLLVLSVLLATGAGTAHASGYDHLLAPDAACPRQGDVSLDAAAQEQVMECMVNFARRQSGRPALTGDPRLMDAADRKAQDIVRCQQFSHTACGRDFAFHIRAVGYPMVAAGENIAWGSGRYGTVRSRMSGWLNSEGHRANLLSARFADQGIALVKTTFQGYPGAQVWVNQLGARRAG
jgi:uncharacterized protein YkwD